MRFYFKFFFLLPLLFYVATLRAITTNTTNASDAADKNITLISEEEQNCQTVDLNDSLGPIRNQSNVGWCFANASADLLTYAYNDDLKSAFSLPKYKAINQVDVIQVSGIFSALHYFNSELSSSISKTNSPTTSQVNSPTSLQSTSSQVNLPANNYSELKNTLTDGGLILKALRIVQARGYICPQLLDNQLINSGLKLELKEKFIFFKELYELKQKSSYLKLTTASSSNEFQVKFDNLLQELKSNDSLITHLSNEDLDDVLSSSNLEMAVMRMLDKLCGDYKINIKKYVKFSEMNRYAENPNFFYNRRLKEKFSTTQAFAEIDNILYKNKNPIAMIYDVDKVLNDPKISSGSHASVISGRKIIDGQCHYQIRNSWGKICSGDFVIENTLYKNHNIYKYPCTEGTFWVPRKDLINIGNNFIYDINGL